MNPITLNSKNFSKFSKRLQKILEARFEQKITYAEIQEMFSQALGAENLHEMQQMFKKMELQTNTDVNVSLEKPWTSIVPSEPGVYQWRKEPGAEIHNFDVWYKKYGVLTDLCRRCWTLTDFDFIDRNEGQWRQVDQVETASKMNEDVFFNQMCELIKKIPLASVTLHLDKYSKDSPVSRYLLNVNNEVVDLFANEPSQLRWIEKHMTQKHALDNIQSLVNLIEKNSPLIARLVLITEELTVTQNEAFIAGQYDEFISLFSVQRFSKENEANTSHGKPIRGVINKEILSMNLEQKNQMQVALLNEFQKIIQGSIFQSIELVYHEKEANKKPVLKELLLDWRYDKFNLFSSNKDSQHFEARGRSTWTKNDNVVYEKMVDFLNIYLPSIVACYDDVSNRILVTQNEIVKNSSQINQKSPKLK